MISARCFHVDPRPLDSRPRHRSRAAESETAARRSLRARVLSQAPGPRPHGHVVSSLEPGDRPFSKIVLLPCQACPWHSALQSFLCQSCLINQNYGLLEDVDNSPHFMYLCSPRCSRRCFKHDFFCTLCFFTLAAVRDIR